MSGARRAFATCVAVLALGAITGCAQNAIFELTLDLPPAPATPRVPGADTYAVVQIRSGTSEAFTDDWAGGDPLDGFLLTSERQTIPVSVIGDADHEALPLRLKIRFCIHPRCLGVPGDDTMSTRQCVEFGRVFYVGQTTSYTHRIDTVPSSVTCSPAEVLSVDKCDVRGCREGDTTFFCRMEDGSHFCE